MTKMKLEDLQNKVDEEKYFASINAGTDMSGNMLYCDHCTFKDYTYARCKLSHEDRKLNNVCARAYNRKNAKRN